MSGRDRGSGSVLALAVIAAVLTLALTAIPLYGVLVARSAVAGAADAAALAAADARVGVVGGLPCQVAAEVAEANGARLASCEVDGYVATVRVERAVGPLTVAATASAGPPPD